MDILQVFLLVSLILLTTLMVFLGVQVYFILQEFRLTLKILQRTLQNTAEISDMVKNPVSALTKVQGWGNVLNGLREGIKLYKTFRKRDE
jgi:hypothetical protein